MILGSGWSHMGVETRKKTFSGTPEKFGCAATKARSLIPSTRTVERMSKNRMAATARRAE
jgi:hypothetical protein